LKGMNRRLGPIFVARTAIYTSFGKRLGLYTRCPQLND